MDANYSVVCEMRSVKIRNLQLNYLGVILIYLNLQNANNGH